jgi:hypothetical protein
VIEAIDPKSAAGIKALLNDQTKAMAEAMAQENVPLENLDEFSVPTYSAQELMNRKDFSEMGVEESRAASCGRNGRSVQEAEFAADLSTVARDEGAETTAIHASSIA